MNSEIKSPLYGLVLAGGQSTRMKTDKSLLNYHGQSQVEFCFGLLAKVCDKAFVSNRPEQAGLPEHAGQPQIHDADACVRIGPLGGILSALQTHRQVAWLVVACDLPFLTEDGLRYLIQNRNPREMATVYKSTRGGMPEPLCAIYEPASFARLAKCFDEGITCPRKILMNMDIALITQEADHLLENVNDPQEYVKAKERLKSGH